MYKSAVKKYVHKQFLKADVHPNGNRSWDLQIHNDDFFSRVAFEGSMGLGESYMDGWIEVKQLDETIKRIMEAELSHTNVIKTALKNLGSLIINRQSKKRALVVGKEHYDLSNRLFECMLDKRLTYSCAYWKDATNLNEAQEAKLDLICRKLRIKPGSKVLDIGCGWGSFAKFAAEKYGAHVVGITISQEQLEYAKKNCKGYPIDLRFQDYRDINEKFDYIVSVGQMEHVGKKNYRTYMKIAAKALKDDGLFLLHTIGSKISVSDGDPWMEKYIFPNGMLPSIAQLASAAEGLFVIEDLHNFGAHYDKTLMAWKNNFDAHWDELKKDYDERFYRMWNYYLLACAGAFRSRHMQLWQIVLSKKGVPGGYISVR